MTATVNLWTRASEVAHGISGDEENREVAYWAQLSEPIDDGDSDYGDRIIRAHAMANAPIMWDDLPRSTVSLQQITPIRFLVVVKYARNTQTPAQKTPGTIRISFETSLENVKIRRAESQQKFPASTAPDYGKFINVVHEDDKIRVEGTDFPFPLQEFSIQLTQDHTFFTTEYLRRCRRYVGKLNDRTFFSNPRGSVMFYGFRGSVENSGNSDLTYVFKYRDNPTLPKDVAGITIPSGTDVVGWDVVWEKNGPEATAVNHLSIAAEGVYIARVGKFVDFRWLGLDVTDPPTGSWVEP